MNKARKYDMKMAYDKNLKPSARLHYLENERHDAPGKMMGKGVDKSPLMKKGSFMSKHCSSSPAKMYGHSPAKETVAQEKKNLMNDMPVDEKSSALRMYGKKK